MSTIVICMYVHVMLKSFSNITTQTYCPLTWPQEISKLDDRKNFNVKNRGIGIESEKYASQLEIKKYGNKLKREFSDHRTKG